MTQTILILGASGRFGRQAADAFAAAGWQVRRFRRGHDDLALAAKGADLILNAWNPPYTAWAAELPRLTQQAIAAAAQSGATVMIPGNVYVYGAGAPPVFAAGTTHGATNPLGRLRIEMEAAYRDAGLRTIILRAGDYLDTRASGNWFDQIMAAKAHRGLFRYPGALDRAHAWAFLPDLARAAVALADRRDALVPFADVPFPGFTLSGAELGAAVQAATSRPVRVKRMSWLPIQLARPVWPMAKHLLEMRYLWDKPHRVDGAGFDALVPGFQATPVEDALRQALAPLVQ